MSLLFEKESYEIRGAAFEVYKELGCGHKEVVYQNALEMAFANRSLQVEREKHISVFFNHKKLERIFRISK